MNLLIRADANVSIGTGHVMRCLALAQAWHDAGGKTVFVLAEGSPALEDRLLREGAQLVRLPAVAGSPDDAQRTSELAAKLSVDWIVVDGYHFSAEYQDVVRGAHRRLLVIDDTGHAGHYTADLLLNQNAYAQPSMYSQLGANTRRLLGPGYALLRREFAAWREWERRTPSDGCRILVTMGGSDPDNFTLRVIEGLRMLRVPDCEATVLIGGANPHRELLQRASLNSPSLRLETDVNDMPAAMAASDLAVAGAGTTSLEMWFMGLPALLIDLADNQTRIAAESARLGFATYLGNSQNVTPSTIAAEVGALMLDPGRRRSMSERARTLVDGKGAQRVVEELCRV